MDKDRQRPFKGGHGQPAALSPAHEIWFSGNTIYILPSVSTFELCEGIVSDAFNVLVNPIRSGTWINTGCEAGSIRIFDLTGRVVHSEAVHESTGGFYWNVSGSLPAGIYTIAMTRNGYIETKNVTVIR